MNVDWKELAARVDDAVDDQFGERARIVPVLGGSYAPAQDASRAPVEVVGEFETLSDFAMNLAGDHSGQQFTQRVALGDFVFHVRTALIAAVRPAKGDIVELLDRGGERYEISRVAPGATSMTKLHMIRVR